MTLRSTSTAARPARSAARTTSPRATSSRATASLAGLDVRRAGLRLVRVTDQLARVTRPNGEVAGYVERLDEGGTVRWRAKRFHARQRRFETLADFWREGDAVDAFRWS